MTTPDGGKDNPIAMLSAVLLNLVAIGCVSLGLWRVGTDLDWAGDFVYQTGFLSHWQVWIAAAVGLQYVSWRLARASRPQPVDFETTNCQATDAPSARVFFFWRRNDTPFASGPARITTAPISSTAAASVPMDVA